MCPTIRRESRPARRSAPQSASAEDSTEAQSIRLRREFIPARRHRRITGAPTCWHDHCADAHHRARPRSRPWPGQSRVLLDTPGNLVRRPERSHGRHSTCLPGRASPRLSRVRHRPCHERGSCPARSGDHAGRRQVRTRGWGRRADDHICAITPSASAALPSRPADPARSLANEPDGRLGPFTLTSTVNSLGRPWITTPAWSGSAIPWHLPQAQVSGMVRGQVPHPVCRSYPDRPSAESQARTRRTRSIWHGGSAGWSGSGSRGARKVDRVQVAAAAAG